uniref:RING-type domain-containing protein n=1 Tax=Neolamprologus brichardi TaxID=32507 RepID=A0A3Q4MMX5_NEOBR
YIIPTLIVAQELGVAGSSRGLDSLGRCLTCPVCLDLYRDPHLLPCGHNFCKTCLDRLKRQAERSHFRCPECRNSHQCNTNFQKNFKLANIADDYRHRRRVRAMPPTALKSRDLPSSSLVPQPCRNGIAVPCDYCPSGSAEAPAVSAAVDCSSAASVSQQGGDSEGSLHVKRETVLCLHSL